ncbi:ImmA/IrrE family metallo-endopeptidase [Gorillibacterium massiliense]|uniref:ImmA/IrrE family metallo-endopeptidase n=1 Tax=Gorillibacterium massiliense TaxID=1280390 RepID=UPI0004B1E7FF|nr:ImmA/IrrE family metallo-endopeptidase [Gorillibacterium massiliense]
MLALYKPTPFEMWIEAFFQNLDISSTAQLNIDYIAERMDIWVYYQEMQSCHIDRGGLFSVNIDKRLTPSEQWEDFLHELCHVLRHAGNQFHLPEPLMEWQEQNAATFQLYAAVPFYLLKTLNMPAQEHSIVEFLVSEFHVTYTLAEKRLRQIQRRILQGVLDQEFMNSLKEPYKGISAEESYAQETYRLQDQLTQLREPKGLPDIRVFCDFATESQTAFYIKATFHPDEPIWSETYLRLPLISPFQTLTWDELDEEPGIRVGLDDLTTIPGRPNEIGVYLPSLRMKYPKEQLEMIRSFILSIEEIEEVLQAEFDPNRRRTKESSHELTQG